MFLRPMKFDKTPNTQLPSMAPIEKQLPIHDVSVNVSGAASGESCSDCNFGKFGDNQPIAMPWHKLIIFAIHTHRQGETERKQKRSK